jgi:predicted ATPase/DNA-binding winged helix-turn-helix (wHTH) protein
METRVPASPATRQTLYFGEFSFDLPSGRLTREGTELSLGRTAAKVLAVLLTGRQHTVTQVEIRRSVWPSQSVDRGAVKGYISDIRAILQDDPRAPRFVASIDGGYRFIATVSPHSPVQRAAKRASVVGRDEVLQGLHDRLARALDGRRSFVFVTGEPGIGKTTTVEVFLEQAEAAHHLLTGRGQCVEYSGPGMAYLPVLEALERISSSEAGPRVLAVLRQHAPTWLAQLPAALVPDDPGALERSVQGATQERRFRELARAVEMLTAELPLVLWFEDLHWCDPETIALLSFLARRTEPARLCVIGTYRPVEVIVHQHPVRALAQELHAQGIGAVSLLPFLSPAAIGAYLRHRFASCDNLPLQDLTDVLLRRTEGNPLFMVRMLDYAVAQGIIADSDGGWALAATKGELEALFPASLHDLIARELAQVTDEERQALEAASVVGEEFTLAEVAAALQLDNDVVDQRCERLVGQRQLLQLGEPERWPDGTVTIRARFGHALYRHAIYDRLAPTRKLAWHGRIGARKAAAFGDHTGPIAAELATHFARAGNAEEAVRYHVDAGQVALRQQAHHVAVAQYTAGLEQLAHLPDTPARAEQEVGLQVALGVAQMATKGYGAPEVEHAYARALALCQKMSEAPQLFPTLYGLWGFHLTRAEYRTARPLAERMLRSAQAGRDTGFLLQAHQAVGLSCYFQGEFVAAREHLDEAMPLYDSDRHRSHIALYGHDPAVVCLSYLALVLWILGYPDRALQSARSALVLAREIAYTPSLALAIYFAGMTHNWRGEWNPGLQHAREAVSFATQHGLPFWVGLARCVLGWILARQGRHEEGVAELREGLAMSPATGARLGVSHRLAALAEAHGEMGQHAEGLSVLAEAHSLCEGTGELLYSAEVARLKGVLLLRQAEEDTPPTQRSKRKGKSDTTGTRRLLPSSAAAEAEACFLQALAIAQQQHAKAWELRAALSLARLWRQQGKTKEARNLLGDIHGWFTEGFDTGDLQEAKTLLRELA